MLLLIPVAQSLSLWIIRVVVAFELRLYLLSFHLFSGSGNLLGLSLCLSLALLDRGVVGIHLLR
jgi:hypothetical protein